MGHDIIVYEPPVDEIAYHRRSAFNPFNVITYLFLEDTYMYAGVSGAGYFGMVYIDDIKKAINRINEYLADIEKFKNDFPEIISTAKEKVIIALLEDTLENKIDEQITEELKYEKNFFEKILSYLNDYQKDKVLIYFG